LAARKTILTALIVAVALPAAGMSMAEWDAQFIKSLWQRGYNDLASQQADLMIKGAGTGPEWATALTRLASSFLEISTETVDEQRALIANARTALEAAAKAAPEIVKTIDYRVEVAAINQRVASSLAERLPEVQGEERKKLEKEIDETFGKVEAQFEEVIKECNKRLDRVYEDNPETEEEAQEQERKVDELLLQMSIYKLRQAIVLYDWLETYDARQEAPRRAELLKSLKEGLETLAWEGEGTSIFLYAKYYEGLVYKKEKNYQKAAEAFKAAAEAPEEIHVPQIMVPLYLEYVDVLIKTENFREANRLLNSLRRREELIAGNEARIEILRATNLFAWAYFVKVHSPGHAARINELYDEAMAICRTVIKNCPDWTGTVNKLMDEWSRKIRGGEGERDINVLLARGRVLYSEKKYDQAVEPFREAVAAVKAAPDKTRVHAGWYLAMCYYHLGQNYEAAATADFLAMRFDPDEFEYSERAFNVGIICLQRQFQKTQDKFDKELYIDFRKKLGEDKFKVFEANNLMEERKYEEALSKLREVPEGSEAYPMAQYLGAECTSKVADDHWKNKRYEEALRAQARAVKLFREFLDWSAGHSVEGGAATRRQDVEARAIFKLARLLTGTPGMTGARFETYYEAIIKRGRHGKADLAGYVRACAEGMLQPVPQERPESREAALAMIRELVRQRHRYVLELTRDFAARYPDATVVAPYVYHLRITAAIQLGQTDVAEQDVLALKKYPEFQSRMAGIYGNLATVFDSKARKLEKENQEEAAQQAFDKALAYYQEMLEADPEQGCDMLYYIIVLMHKHGRNVALNTKLDLVSSAVEKCGGELDEERAAQVKLIQADWLFEHGDRAPSFEIYHALFERLEKEYEKRKEKDPAAARSSVHWNAMLGLARSRKALGKYAEAIRDFDTIRKNIPDGRETWWMATFELLDCMTESKDVPGDLVIQKMRTIYLLRPNLGGPDTRDKFLLLLAKLAKSEDENVKKQAMELIKQIEDHGKETQ